MSFSKARIIRFNDVPCASPANTTPKTKLKNANSVGNRSPTLSENGSVKSVPGNFKTPTLPKKSKTVTSATKTIPKDLFNDLEALKEKTEECESKTKYILKLTEELENCTKALDNLKTEKEQLQREHQNEIQDLEFEMLKTMTELQKKEEEAGIRIKEMEDKLQQEMDTLKKAHEYQIGQVVLDYEIKLKDLKESSEASLRWQMTELEKEWKDKLNNQAAESEAILKECQAIWEYSVIQSELEKNALQQPLEELRLQYQNLKQKYDKAVADKEEYSKKYAKTQEELHSKIRILTEKLKKKEEDIAQLNVEAKAFQITINNSQITIEVLKKRLMNSDKDVEQLKQELNKCEDKLIEIENKCCLLNSDLQEARNYNEELELQYESAISMNRICIENLRGDLLRKVDQFEEEVKKYSSRLKREQEEKQEIIEELSNNIEMVKKINRKLEETEELYSELEEAKEVYTAKEKGWMNEVNELKEQNNKLNEENIQKESIIQSLKADLEEAEHKHTELEDTCKYYKTKAEEFESEARESTLTRKNYIEVSGRYDVLMQDYEAMAKENLEYKMQVEKMEKLMKIEEEYEKLRKEKEQLESENLAFKNKLEDQKLRKYKFAAKDKENIGSPNRSLLDSPNRGSPYKSSPFRERN